MTLSASYPVKATTINVELDRASGAAFDMQGNLERMLAGASTGAVSMSDFLGKTALFLTGSAGPSGTSTSHTFTGVDFGLSYTNRRILVYVLAQGKNSGVTTPAAVNVTSMTVGGVSGVIPTNGLWYNTGNTASTDFAGVASDSFNPSGTSGTISFTTTIALNCSIVVFSMVGSNSTAGSSNGAFTNTSPISDTLDVQANATLIVAGVQKSGATLTMSGCTKRLQFSHVAGYQCVIGYDNHLGAQTGRAISITGSAGATAMITDGWVW